MRTPRLQQFVQEFGLTENQLLGRTLVEYEEAQSLVIATVDPNGREHWLCPEAAEAWQGMQIAAVEAGISLFIVSAYRSVERQAAIIRRKLALGQSIEQVLSVSALPGCSEHHTGRAIDLGTNGSALLEAEFEQSPAFTWLQQNAPAFGFNLSYPRENSYGYDFEPWHWCYQDS